MTIYERISHHLENWAWKQSTISKSSVASSVLFPLAMFVLFSLAFMENRRLTCRMSLWSLIKPLEVLCWTHTKTIAYKRETSTQHTQYFCTIYVNVVVSQTASWTPAPPHCALVPLPQRRVGWGRQCNTLGCVWRLRFWDQDDLIKGEKQQGKASWKWKENTYSLLPINERAMLCRVPGSRASICLVVVWGNRGLLERVLKLIHLYLWITCTQLLNMGYTLHQW